MDVKVSIASGGILVVGGTYQYNGWMFVVVREPGPGGTLGSFEVLSLSDYNHSLKAGHLIEVTQNSAVAQYSARVA
jgi:hypothetical protein